MCSDISAFRHYFKGYKGYKVCCTATAKCTCTCTINSQALPKLLTSTNIQLDLRKSIPVGSTDRATWFVLSYLNWMNHNNIGIQIKQKELTKTCMMILIWKTLWSPWFIQIHFSVVRVDKDDFYWLHADTVTDLHKASRNTQMCHIQYHC